MTTPGQTLGAKTFHPTTAEPASRRSSADISSRHHATQIVIEDPSNPLAIFGPCVLPVADPAELASTEKTRAALFKLNDSPHDSSALATLWNENRLSIENELHRHLHSNSNSPLLEKLLANLVWHASFFCHEVDDPKAWVARCANLEARRMVLQLMETR